MQIQALAIYPNRDGVAYIYRQQTPYQQPIGPEWPTMEVGQELEIFDTQGWIWNAIVQEVLEKSVKIQVVGEKKATPFPQIVDGWVRLPNISGHAHCRSWSKGDVVTVDGAYYKIAKKPLLFSSEASYNLVPVTPEQYAKRPGRIKMDSFSTAHEAVGSAIKTDSGEWLHIKKVVSYRYGSSEGETFGKNYYGEGVFVPEKKAQKLNDNHGHLLSQILHNAKASRYHGTMPETSKVLIPRKANFSGASGESVALLNDSTVLHQRCGDPDMIDSWYSFIVEITDKDVVAKVKRFLSSTLCK